MFNLCQYKNALGIPRQGIHSYRLFDFALADIIMTIVGAYIISKIINYQFWYVLIILFLLGVLLHYLFCVETKFMMLILL